MIKKLEKITTASLADRAREQIREAIFSGQIKPQERLTIERIAADLGISRTPVREALKALEADGIVQILPNKGAVVQPFSHEEIRDRYAVRALLEGEAGANACRNAPDAVAAALEANCVLLEQRLREVNLNEVEDLKSLMRLNDEFHQSILDAGGSPVIIKMLAMLQMPISYRLYLWRDSGRQAAVLALHREIAAAFRAHDPERARQLLHGHIDQARDLALAGS